MEKNNKNNRKYNDRGAKSYGKGGPHRDGQKSDRRPARDNKSVGKYDHVDHSAQAEHEAAAANEELGSGIVIGTNCPTDSTTMCGTSTKVSPPPVQNSAMWST